MSFNQTAYCHLLLKIKMQISGQKFDTDHLSEETEHFEAGSVG